MARHGSNHTRVDARVLQCPKTRKARTPHQHGRLEAGDTTQYDTVSKTRLTNFYAKPRKLPRGIETPIVGQGDPGRHPTRVTLTLPEDVFTTRPSRPTNEGTDPSGADNPSPIEANGHGTQRSCYTATILPTVGNGHGNVKPNKLLRWFPTRRYRNQPEYRCRT